MLQGRYDHSNISHLPAEHGVTVLETLETCGNADDVFFDSRRQRIYVSCGSGDVDVFTEEGRAYRLLARIATKSGARTSLFVPELDRLFVAERPGILRSDAALLVFRLSS